jgi:hypothetical protein
VAERANPRDGTIRRVFGRSFREIELEIDRRGGDVSDRRHR